MAVILKVIGEMEDTSSSATPRNSISCFRVSKLKELEQINVELLEKVKTLENVCNQLHQENVSLRAQFAEIQTANQNLSINEDVINMEDSSENTGVHAENNVVQPTVYLTDEEELARETEWILKKKKKSQKRSNTLTQQTDDEVSTTPAVQEMPAKTPENAETAEPRPPTRPLRPPPIIVSAVENFGELRNIIKPKAVKGFIAKQINKHSQKISTFEVNDYREVTKALNEANIPWHSFENKHERPIRVIAKNLHHTCDPIEIISDLKAQGFKILNAFNKTHFYTKDPLDIFILSFDPTENLDSIYKIKHILNTVVKIETIKLPKHIPQCKNCQGYNHTKNYCSKQPRCARCAGKHETKNCEKPTVFLPKCCNCGEQHPASYRGCIVAKELQKLRNHKQKLQKTLQPQPVENLSQAIPCTSANTVSIPQRIQPQQQRPSQSYSAATKLNSTQQANASKPNYENTLSKILSKLEAIESFNKSLDMRLSILEENFFGTLIQT